MGVSRPPVLDCGTTLDPDYGGLDLPSTPSDNLRKLIYLATEALSDSFEFIGAIEISLSIYLTGSGVRPSVCPIDRQQQRRPVGLLLSALPHEISIDSCGRAAGAGAQHRMRVASC